MTKRESTLIDVLRQHPPSIVVGAFVDWLSEMKDEQEKADEIFRREDGPRVQDFLHEFEFENSAKKRAIIATRCHKSRMLRRNVKDKMTALKPIKEFVTNSENKYFFKRLRKLQTDLLSQEEYLAGEREYKPRVKDEGGEDD